MDGDPRALQETLDDLLRQAAEVSVAFDHANGTIHGRRARLKVRATALCDDDRLVGHLKPVTATPSSAVPNRQSRATKPEKADVPPKRRVGRKAAMTA